MDTKTKWGIGLIIACIALFGIILGVYNAQNSKSEQVDFVADEWVSPDGVHYWYHDGGYGEMLAPRYDSNGNLVID